MVRGVEKTIHTCQPAFRDDNDLGRLRTLVHEGAHLDSLDVIDHGYDTDPDCADTSATAGFSVLQRITNADSFACLFWALNNQ